MKNFAKKLSAVALCTVFASMQVSAATITTGDTGLGAGLGGANITGAQGGYVGTDLSTGTANVNVNGDAHVIWGNLNLNKGENLNFNTVNGANGVSVVNTVTNGMSQIYGNISADKGVAKLIISNPNGMLYDGASFQTSGDVMLTTQALGVNFVNGKLDLKGLEQAAKDGAMITIKNSDFSVGGEFNITSPSIDIVKSVLGTTKGLKLITADGQNYLVSPTVGQDQYHTAVRLESVEINGKVYIMADKDIVKIVNGGKIDGDLTIESDGNVALNYSNKGEQLYVTGDVNVTNDARTSYLRNAKVDGDVNMSNSGGFLEVNNIEVGGDVNLTTTVKTNKDVKHFVHVVGDNKIAGDLNINSAHNIHIGGYNTTNDKPSDLRKEGSLTVGGDINAKADYGSIAITVDTKATNAKMEAGLNILSDGQATLTADTYEFTANHYIGGVNSGKEIVDVMENYLPLPREGYTYLNIAGGDVNKIKTSEDGRVLIKSEGNMNVNGVNAPKLNLTSNQNDIVIGEDVHAEVIKVGEETKTLKVEFPSRDYTLKYTNIRDNEVKTINSTDEITYELTNGENGYNQGTQTANNTYLVGPDKPIVTPPDDPTPPGPVDPKPPVIPDDNGENVRVMGNFEKDKVTVAIDANEVYTPVAFAADLDDEIDTGVRKNVDGSVTVVRAFTPSN